MSDLVILAEKKCFISIKEWESFFRQDIYQKSIIHLTVKITCGKKK